jgi:hypothetical protein
MIAVRVRQHDHLYPRRVQSHPAHARQQDALHVFTQRERIDQHQPFGRCDHRRADLRRAEVVHVVEHTRGLEAHFRWRGRPGRRPLPFGERLAENPRRPRLAAQRFHLRGEIRPCDRPRRFDVTPGLRGRQRLLLRAAGAHARAGRERLPHRAAAPGPGSSWRDRSPRRPNVDAEQPSDGVRDRRVVSAAAVEVRRDVHERRLLVEQVAHVEAHAQRVEQRVGA